MRTFDTKFALSEATKGLRAHLQMAAAVIVCVTVSLTMVGVSWLLSMQVDHLKGYWYDKVEVSVFLCSAASDPQVCPHGEVTAAERDALRAQLEGLPQTKTVYYESKQEAWARFSHQYAGSRVLSQVSAETMPESFRVKLVDPTQFEVVARAVASNPAVEKVQDQRQLLAGFFRLVAGLQIAALVLAASQVLIAVLVVGATIRISVHARRKEVGIMRLVGASKAMIRAPFLGEAILCGVSGAALAVGLLCAFQQWVVEDLLAARTTGVTYVSWSDLAVVTPALVAAGVLVPTVAAFVGLRRHLKV